MKYYIPTSTNNFNCLLADESISPCGFYEKRGFSYNYFTAIPLNDNKVLLPLFRSCPEFELSDDVPGFPLILEIDINLNENEFRQSSISARPFTSIPSTCDSSSVIKKR